MGRKWHIQVAGKNKYASCFTKRGEGRVKLIFMHREIMSAKPGQMIDHKDGDGLNNSRSNLRFCTPSQNNSNRAAVNKYKGVSWHTASNQWRATICKDKKIEHIGYYKTQEDAAMAYNSRATSLHGDFARLNILT